MKRNIAWASAALAAIAVLVIVVLRFVQPNDAAEQVVTVAADAPNYCQQLSTMPKGLPAAVANAAAGMATSDDKKLIASAVTQLRDVANSKGVPTGLKGGIDSIITPFDKLARGEVLSDREASTLIKSFENIGKAVNSSCVAK